MPAPTTIDGVVDALDRVIDECIERDSRLGYFAALYRNVTVKVRSDIEAGGVFSDGERMEQLDVTFANRYLDAYDCFRTDRPCDPAWKAAFEVADSWRPIIVQQLLVGINVHINLDLGAAAAQVAPGPAIGGLRADFDAINRILGAMVGGVLVQVGEVSPWIRLLDAVGGRDDEAIINFSIDVARDEAWKFAELLAPVADPAPLIARRSRWVADFGKVIVHPGFLLSSALLVIGAREVRDVRRVIEVLAA